MTIMKLHNIDHFPKEVLVQYTVAYSKYNSASIIFYRQLQENCKQFYREVKNNFKI
jgi:hypothetical protein